MSGFAAKIIKQSALVYDLRWRDEHDVGFYAILEVTPSKHEAFKEALASGTSFDMKRYGVVLYIGMGRPDQAVQKSLHKAYGMYDEADIAELYDLPEDEQDQPTAHSA